MKEQLGAIKHETVHEQVYNKVSEALLEGKFAPGDTMKIRDLAEEVGTSVMPVRDALRTLVAENALVSLPNRTVVVPNLDRAEIEEITKYRAVTEGMVAEIAGTKIQKDKITTLKSLDSQMIAALKEANVKLYLSLNRRFHFTLYHAANMPLVERYLHLTWLRVGPLFNHLLVSGDNDKTQEYSEALLCGHHQKAVECAEKHDGIGVKDAIVCDIEENAVYILDYLDAGD